MESIRARSLDKPQGSKTDRSHYRRKVYDASDGSSNSRRKLSKLKDHTELSNTRHLFGLARRDQLHKTTVSQENMRVELHKTKSSRELTKLEKNRQRLQEQFWSRGGSVIATEHDRIRKYELKKELEENDRNIRNLVKEVRDIWAQQERMKHLKTETFTNKPVSLKTNRSTRWDKQKINSQLRTLSNDQFDHIIKAGTTDFNDYTTADAKSSRSFSALDSHIDFNPARDCGDKFSSAKSTFLARTITNHELEEVTVLADEQQYVDQDDELGHNSTVQDAYGLEHITVGNTSKDFRLPDIRKDGQKPEQAGSKSLDESEAMIRRILVDSLRKGFTDLEKCAQSIQSDRKILNRTSSGRVLQKKRRKHKKSSVGNNQGLPKLETIHSVARVEVDTPDQEHDYKIEPNRKDRGLGGERMLAFEGRLRRDGEDSNGKNKKFVRRRTYSSFVNISLKPQVDQRKSLEISLRKERLKVSKPKVMRGDSLSSKQPRA
mmetsp:Transcript_51657/g.59050  ORF Transcript_51657/g.59050 Transcript_51657/m.59050 type:complete len:490 (-) Transcript_51657:182-1651(-)